MRAPGQNSVSAKNFCSQKMLGCLPTCFQREMNSAALSG